MNDLRSNSNIVIAPAKTGRESKRRTAVNITAQENNLLNSNFSLKTQRLKNVVIKLIAPKIELAPAKCKEKIAKSTPSLGCARTWERGGYTVQPVPTPGPIKELDSKRKSEGGRNQNLKLLSRGKAISGAPNIRGTSQLANPPINIGINFFTRSFLFYIQ